VNICTATCTSGRSCTARAQPEVFVRPSKGRNAAMTGHDQAVNGYLQTLLTYPAQIDARAGMR